MTKTLKIEENTAKKLYKNATPEFKIMLEETFGVAFFSQKITDKIRTWDDVCEELGTDDSVLPYKNAKTKRQKSTNAFVKIQYISQALNEGWEPDWSNSNEYKYYPWFKYKSSGGFSFVCVVCHSYDPFLGFGFYYKNTELAEYAGTQFLNIYKEYLG